MIKHFLRGGFSIFTLQNTKPQIVIRKFHSISHHFQTVSLLSSRGKRPLFEQVRFTTTTRTKLFLYNSFSHVQFWVPGRPARWNDCWWFPWNQGLYDDDGGTVYNNVSYPKKKKRFPIHTVGSKIQIPRKRKHMWRPTMPSPNRTSNNVRRGQRSTRNWRPYGITQSIRHPAVMVPIIFTMAIQGCKINRCCTNRRHSMRNRPFSWIQINCPQTERSPCRAPHFPMMDNILRTVWAQADRIGWAFAFETWKQAKIIRKH